MSKEHDRGRGLEELMSRDDDDDEGVGSETKTCGKEMRLRVVTALSGQDWAKSYNRS
jgi:hypothetical protein